MSSADTWAIKAKVRLAGLAGISGAVMVCECGGNGAVMVEDRHDRPRQNVLILPEIEAQAEGVLDETATAFSFPPNDFATRAFQLLPSGFQILNDKLEDRSAQIRGLIHDQIHRAELERVGTSIGQFES